MCPQHYLTVPVKIGWPQLKQLMLGWLDRWMDGWGSPDSWIFTYLLKSLFISQFPHLYLRVCFPISPFPYFSSSTSLDHCTDSDAKISLCCCRKHRLKSHVERIVGIPIQRSLRGPSFVSWSGVWFYGKLQALHTHIHTHTWIDQELWTISFWWVKRRGFHFSYCSDHIQTQRGPYEVSHLLLHWGHKENLQPWDINIHESCVRKAKCVGLPPTFFSWFLSILPISLQWF